MTRSDAPRSVPTADDPDPRRWRALSVTLVAGFMTLLDVSIVAVALPSMQRSLGADPATVQWVVSGYALTFGLALVPAGRLGDALGRRRMFLGALTGFVLCSGLAGAASNVGLLVAARLAQGLAAGSLAPQNSGLIQQMFSGDERGRAFGLFGATVGVSTAIGPIVGGFILALADGPDGWRWIFYVNVPIGVVALVLAARLIPRTAPVGTGRIDVVGGLLLGGCVFAVLLPLAEADAGGLTRLWWLFVVAAVMAVLFVRWERRVTRHRGAPLLDLRLLSRTRGYATGAALGTVYFLGFSGIWIVFALFLQSGVGYTPLQSGLSVTAFAIGSAVSAAVGGRFVERFGRRLTVIGLTGVLSGLGATIGVVLLAPPAALTGALAAPLLVAGLGGGLVISPNITLSLREVPVRMAGSAGGALQTGQRVGAAIGTAALPGAYYLVLGADGENQQVAAAVALSGAVLSVSAALGIAVRDLRNERRARRRRCSEEETHSFDHPARI
ncbi:MAG TPA: MFS transporter [Pseudonocardia sp.]|uniref:MFS transporter n=1 Tax=Pseudonocardia sp. TaxID=60912 RepID=UPI002B4B2CC6|nr:MFS transporter [Pseudonocardia sp.]HLU56651.1 MFS transporter [Pseudonocardia sp.]